MSKECDVTFVSIHYKDGSVQAFDKNYLMCVIDEEGFEFHNHISMRPFGAAGFLLQCMAELGMAADALVSVIGGGKREGV